MERLKPGDEAPPFSLLDQHGNRVSLTDFRGQKVLLYFYPIADTPGCTKQACSVRDEAPELGEADLTVLGISPDAPEEQLAFDQKYGLGFPLLSDPDHAVAEAYGAWGEHTHKDATWVGILRSSFLVDEEGRIVEAWYPIRPADMIPSAMMALK